MDYNGDGFADIVQRYGDGALNDEYLFGDWDGNRTSNVAVRTNNCVYMDYNIDGFHDQIQCYGNLNPPRRPAAPSKVRDATSGTRWNRKLVLWNDNSSDEIGFRVYVNGRLLGKLAKNSTSFLATGLAPSTGYCFTIRSFNAVGESDVHPGGTVCASTSAEPAPSPSPSPSPSPPPPPVHTTGNMNVALAVETSVTARCNMPDDSYDFVTSGLRMPSMLSERPTGNGTKLCVYTGRGSEMNPGSYRVVQNAFAACGSTVVRAGLTANLNLQPYVCN
jgi:hypothetical protein